MQSKSEPPLSSLNKLGWATDFQQHLIWKCFHFSSQELLTDFCFSLLTSKHNKKTNLDAVQNIKSEIEVKIYSKGSEKDSIELARSIESFYKETLKNGKQSNSIWPW